MTLLALFKAPAVRASSASLKSVDEDERVTEFVVWAASPFTVLSTLAEENVPVVVPVMVGLAIVGLVARTMAPLPAVPFERSAADACKPELTRPCALVTTFV